MESVNIFIRNYLQQVYYTLIISAVLAGILLIAKLAVNRYVLKRHIKVVRGKFIFKIIRYGLIMIGMASLVFIWGVNIHNVWVFITGTVGMVAIGFFAVWSILSNILAGVLLFISDPFRLNDHIAVLPEDIRGKVVDMKLLFVVLKDDEGNVIHIPNNIMFQKFIKKLHQPQKTE